MTSPPHGVGAGAPAARMTAEEKLRAGTDIQRRLGIKTSRDEPLARFTTMRVGGPADLFAEVRNLFELRGIVRFARARDIPLFLIGRGSDLVISDAGIGGLVVLVRAQGYQLAGERLVADAGLPMARAASVSRDAGLSGLEFGLAIPGTVGGAVWANAGAHGSDVRAVLEAATVVTADGSEATLGPDELGMSYRETRLKHGVPGPPRGGHLGDLPPPAGRAGGHRRPPGRHPSLATGAPARGPEVGRQCLPQSGGRLGGAHHRRAGAQGPAGGRCGGQPEARQLHRQRRRRQRRRRAPAR